MEESKSAEKIIYKFYYLLSYYMKPRIRARILCVLFI